MSQTHLLIQKAFVYDAVNEPTDPEGCYYDTRLGAWLVEDGNQLLVKSSNHERPKTKKFDQETGEDQKGT